VLFIKKRFRKRITTIIFCSLILINFYTIASSIKIDNNPKNNNITSTSIQWDATINFAETSGKSDWVIFGEATDANDGPPADIYDTQKPPIPPTPYIRAWFDDGLPVPYTQLSGDYRSYPDNYKVWDLTVQWFPVDYSSPTDITISWSVPEITNSEYDSILLESIDMFSQNTYEFTAEALIPYEFQIVCSILPNDPPQFNNENPDDEEDDVSVSSNSLSVYIEDLEDDDFDWSIETSPNIGSSSGTDESDGVKTCSISGLSYSTTYTWYVNTTDPSGSNQWTRETYTFTTISEQNNPPNAPTNPTPPNDATNIQTNPTLSIYVQDPDNDQMTITFYDQQNNPITTKNNIPSGTTTSTTWTNLQYNTDYYWYTTANDGEHTTRGPNTGYWHFKTKQEDKNQPPNQPENPTPPDDATNIQTSPQLSVYVEDPDGDSLTVVFYDASDSSTIDTVNDVTSDNRAEITWPDLSYESTYSWFVIVSDQEFDTQSDSWNFSTKKKPNEVPNIVLTKPEDNSLYIFNRKILRMPFRIRIFGKISIEAEATDDSKVERIELYIDNKKITEEDSDTLKYTWNKRYFLFHRHKIKVIAYDDEGKSSSDERTVWKYF